MTSTDQNPAIPELLWSPDVGTVDAARIAAFLG
jgi:hypothetical protein